MTRKDYVLIAAAIKAAYQTFDKPSNHANGARHVAHTLADTLATDNPRFDRDRFLTACGVFEGKRTPDRGAERALEVKGITDPYKVSK
jgi:hypothetical protein